MPGQWRRPCALALALAAVLPAAAPAWLAAGHRRVAEAAVGQLPAELPAFFRASAAEVGRHAVEPDLWRHEAATALRDSQGPEHYVDLENLRGRALPRERSAYLELTLGELGLPLAHAGTLPYAVADALDLLTLAFAQARRWPGDADVRARVFAAAGRLAHFAADLEQPLHTTIHHDGWALPDGSSPATGFHLWVDTLIERAAPDSGAALAGAMLEPYLDPAAAIRDQLAQSHALLDATYALEPPPGAATEPLSPAATRFACERFRAAATFLARLYLTAWRRSAAVELPDWLLRARER